MLQVALAWLTLSAVVHADTAAEELFRQGRENMSAGRYAEACENFRQSYDLHSGNAALLNLALCEESLGQVAQAWTHFRACLDRLPEGDGRRAIAEEHFKAVDARVAKLTVMLWPKVARPAEVRVDGKRLGDAEIGVTLPLDPGSHEITLIPATGPEERTVVALQEGQSAVRMLGSDTRDVTASGQGVEASLVATRPDADKSAKTSEPDEETDGTQRTLGYAFGGAGLVGLAAAGVMGLMILDRQAIVRDECDNKLCSSEGLAAGEEGRTLVAVAITTTAVSTAALGLGVYLLVTDRPSTTSERSSHRVARKASVGVMNRVTGDSRALHWSLALRAQPRSNGAGLELVGRF